MSIQMHVDLEPSLTLEQAHDIVVGAEQRLLVFLGRITHQKGCDLITEAARDILKCCRTVQASRGR